MKIAYINIIFSKGNMIGVEKKLIAEARIMNKYGIDVYVLNRGKDRYENNIFFKKVDNYFTNKILFEIYLRTFKMNVIRKIVNMDKYDLIFLRYPLMDFSSLSYVKKYGFKTITEHHGKELEEIINYRIKIFFKVAQYFMEKLIAPSFLKKIKGLTAISNELIDYEVKRTGFKGLTYRFSNGINSKKYQINFEKKFNFKERINILFIASNFAKWHGLDRLIKSLSIYKGSTKINLYIVGGINNEYLKIIKDFQNRQYVNIIVCGKLDGEELDDLYKNINIACDSLAMYRINMQESSTLKSKEYVVRGIPFLYSAIDNDLVNVKKYLYYVGNDDSIIDFQEIINFYSKVDTKIMLYEFYNYAKNILDWNIKIKNLIKFFEIKEAN